MKHNCNITHCSKDSTTHIIETLIVEQLSTVTIPTHHRRGVAIEAIAITDVTHIHFLLPKKQQSITTKISNNKASSGHANHICITRRRRKRH